MRNYKKQCSKCKKWKEFNKFYKRNGIPEGKCKNCISIERKIKRSNLTIHNMKHGVKFLYNNVKKSIESIKDYELISKEYKNITTNIIIKHLKCEGEFKITFANFRSGQRCPYCRKNKRIYWKDVMNVIEDNNYKMISIKKDYKTTNSKLIIECKNGHQRKITYTGFKSSKKLCLECNNLKKIKFSDIKKSFINEGWKIFTKESEYKGQNTTPKIDCECPNGHRQFKNIRKWRMGRRCQYCNTSGSEIKLRELFKEYNVLFNDRKVLNGLELDFYFPNLGKAIEYNGNYWHCNPLKYNRDYFHKHKQKFAWEIWEKDKYKQDRCKELNINLLILWENDIDKKKVKEFIEG